jgi:hypothetical protein
MNQTCDKKIEQHGLVAHDCGNALVSLAPQFIRYTVNCTSRDSASHLPTHLVVYIIARCSSLNTTTFCLIHVCPVLPHPTALICKLLAEKDVGKEEDRRQVISLLFEAF